jgi:YggT family protein
MLTQVLVFLLETFLGLFALALLLRFFLQLMRAPVRNPLSTFVAALTDWIVVPTRRFVPGLFRIDLSTLVLAWLAELLLLGLKHWMLGPGLGNAGPAVVALAALAAIQIVKLSLWMLIVAVLVQAVLTWVAPHSPAMPVLNSLARPFLAVFQRRIPPVGNVDLSPIFVLVGCRLLLYLVGYIEAAVAG